MKRRDFLGRFVGGMAAAGLAGHVSGLRASGQGHASRAGWDGKLHEIAISTWSLHNYFQITRDEDFKLPGDMLDLLDFPEMIVDRYKVHHLEICAPHFASTEAGYLQDLKARLQKAHTHVVNMPVDIEELWTEGGLSDANPQVRDKAVAACKKWIDIGGEIGTRSVRCDPGKMNPQKLEPTVAAYKELAAYGNSRGVYVIIENHGGVGSEHPEELVKLFKDVDSDFFGALPDFGNFPDEQTRERGLELLFPFASVVCHAKGLEIDSQGKETKFDFPRCIATSKKMGFKGIYSIEYEGPGDPYAGVQKVLNELVEYL
ncbi:MAG: sugar phosphate isomerase/epimerase [Acidobacteriia bacterium]|nr:sugar phosphate isomerase/epimerase [Terriglobia bacterium]